MNSHHSEDRVCAPCIMHRMDFTTAQGDCAQYECSSKAYVRYVVEATCEHQQRKPRSACAREKHGTTLPPRRNARSAQRATATRVTLNARASGCQANDTSCRAAQPQRSHAKTRQLTAVKANDARVNRAASDRKQRKIQVQATKTQEAP
jgi:hypothetical protein